MSLEGNFAICLKIVGGLGWVFVYILNKPFNGVINDFLVQHTGGAMIGSKRSDPCKSFILLKLTGKSVSSTSKNMYTQKFTKDNLRLFANGALPVTTVL